MSKKSATLSGIHAIINVLDRRLVALESTPKDLEHWRIVMRQSRQLTRQVERMVAQLEEAKALKVVVAGQKPITEFATELSDAYSTGRYKGGWGPCIRMLRKLGCDDQQIEAIIRSKWTRWAADEADKGHNATSKDLERFVLEQGKSEIAVLTAEHFGILSQKV